MTQQINTWLMIPIAIEGWIFEKIENKAISVNPRITQQGNNFTTQPLALEYARDNPKQITKDIGKI